MISVTIDPAVSATVGVVHAAGVRSSAHPSVLASAMERALALRSGGLPVEDEAVRLAARDMLRHGRYKPTGRGKPASEYLLRAAAEGDFPRINAPVDVCNLVSVQSLLPISVWDVDRAAATRYLVRYGLPGESYVFNSAGQEIQLEDLLLAARVRAGDDRGEPVVNPVKDSMATKTDDATTHVAALIYAPPGMFMDRLQAALSRFAELIAACGARVAVGTAVATPGESIEI